MDAHPVTPRLTALRSKVAALVGGRLLVWSAHGSTVFRADGTKDPVQPVRSPPDQPPRRSRDMNDPHHTSTIITLLCLVMGQLMWTESENARRRGDGFLVSSLVSYAWVLIAATSAIGPYL